MNESDLLALIAGCRTAETRVIELCTRFGTDPYEAACAALIDRTRRRPGRARAPLHPRGAGHLHRLGRRRRDGQRPVQDRAHRLADGDVCHVDWTGTDAQAPGTINFRINDGLCRLFFGIYLIMAFDPSVLFNDGVRDVFDVTLPEGTLLNPTLPGRGVEPAQRPRPLLRLHERRDGPARA